MESMACNWKEEGPTWIILYSLSPPIEYEIKREEDRVRKVFQDPTGAHLLVAMKSKECYYVGQASKKAQPRLLPKVKGQVIESVAWNKMEMKEPGGGTGAILLGTSQGSIYETDILFEDSLLKQRKGYFAEVSKSCYCLCCMVIHDLCSYSSISCMMLQSTAPTPSLACTLNPSPTPAQSATSWSPHQKGIHRWVWHDSTFFFSISYIGSTNSLVLLTVGTPLSLEISSCNIRASKVVAVCCVQYIPLLRYVALSH